MDEKNSTIICGDCLEILQTVPDHSVDLILTDPPYGMTDCDWDKAPDLDAMWAALKRAAKPDAAICIFGIHPFLDDLIESNRKEFKYVWYWYKHYKRGFLNAKKQPLRNIEEIAVFYSKQCRYNPEMTQGKKRIKSNSPAQGHVYTNYRPLYKESELYYPSQLLDFPGVPVNELKFSTEKPVPLLRYLIRTYTNPGDIVLDPYMGSGSTGEAALRENRRFIGIEKDKQIFDIADKRIQDVQQERNDRK